MCLRELCEDVEVSRRRCSLGAELRVLLGFSTLSAFDALWLCCSPALGSLRELCEDVEARRRRFSIGAELRVRWEFSSLSAFDALLWMRCTLAPGGLGTCLRELCEEASHRRFSLGAELRVLREFAILSAFRAPRRICRTLALTGLVTGNVLELKLRRAGGASEREARGAAMA